MPDDPDAPGAGPHRAVPTATDGEVEAYETEDGVVLYDASNPLAWLESHAPVRLEDAE